MRTKRENLSLNGLNWVECEKKTKVNLRKLRSQPTSVDAQR